MCSLFCTSHLITSRHAGVIVTWTLARLFLSIQSCDDRSWECGSGVTTGAYLSWPYELVEEGVPGAS